MFTGQNGLWTGHWKSWTEVDVLRTRCFTELPLADVPSSIRTGKKILKSEWKIIYFFLKKKNGKIDSLA